MNINIRIYIYIVCFLGTLTFCNITLNNPSVFVCRKPTAKLLESCLTWLIFANLFSTDWINCQQLPMALTFPLPTQVSRLSTRVGPHSPVTLGKRYYVEILNDENISINIVVSGHHTVSDIEHLMFFWIRNDRTFVFCQHSDMQLVKLVATAKSAHQRTPNMPSLADSRG